MLAQPLLSLLLAAPAAAGGVGPEEESALPRIVEDQCRQGASSGEVVVCGRRDPDRYRMTGLPTKQEQKIRDAGIPVGIDLNGTTRAGVVIDQVQFPQGMISRRAMVSVRIKF